MNLLKPIFLIFLAVLAAQAAKVVAVLEITPADETVELKLSEFRHLTDELRTQAREALPSEYSILTRDNIMSLMPQDAEKADCLAESCAVEIGREIGAEYVTQGSIGNFSNMITLTVELYESLSGNMLGSFVTESNSVMGLLSIIREKAPALFKKAMSEKETLRLNVIENINKIKAEPPPIPDPVKTPATKKAAEPPPPAPPQKYYYDDDYDENTEYDEYGLPRFEEKKKIHPMFAVALDIAGAAFIGYGFYQRNNANRLNDDYANMPQGMRQDEYDDALKKANDALKRRNIGYIVGGVLLATGITVHIWF
ncbi:MAG: DUF3280 domain-containing protein [Fibromonadales bacterium]|nr:DUF3280 domain-containing protein [Fibromonadales bacterium]